MHAVKRRVERTEVDGVPVFWADVPGVEQVALMFRAGRGDETLATSGLTHLVEHLTLFAVGDERRRVNGFVDHLHTVFYASGSLSEQAEFVSSVAAAMNALPLDRLELEKRVLLTEAASAARGSLDWLLALRFGASGFGLLHYKELGLHRLTESEVVRWTSDRFVKANAALWMTSEPPATFGLALPDGPRHEAPSSATIAELGLPAYMPSSGGGVVCSFVGSRSTALTVALGLLEQRVHRNLRLRRGLSYAATGTYLPLGAHIAHVTFGADCLDEHAAVVRDEILEELQRFAAEGPEPEELSTLVEESVQHWSETEPITVAELDQTATDYLLGAPRPSRAELIEERRSLTPQTVAEAVRQILPTVILAAPTGDVAPPGFSRFEPSATPPVRGHRYMKRARTNRHLPSRSPFVSSEHGISFVGKALGKTLTISFADVAAVLELGPGRLEIISRVGHTMRVDTTMLLRGDRLEDELRRGVPDHLFVPFQEQGNGSAGSIVDLARLKLGYRTHVAAEIEALAGYLQPGERVLTLAAAHRRSRGLLALTDRRVLFLANAASRKPRFLAISLADVTGVRRRRPAILRRGITITTTGKRYSFVTLTPRQRTTEFLEALSTPDNPTFTPRTIDTTPKGALRAYGLRATLTVLGAALILANVYAAVWLLIVGGVGLVRTYNRRRALKSIHLKMAKQPLEE